MEASNHIRNVFRYEIYLPTTSPHKVKYVTKSSPLNQFQACGDAPIAPEMLDVLGLVNINMMVHSTKQGLMLGEFGNLRNPHLSRKVGAILVM